MRILCCILLAGQFCAEDEEEEDDVEVIEDLMTNPPLPDKFQKTPQMRVIVPLVLNVRLRH